MYRLSFFLMAAMLIAGSAAAQTWTFTDVSYLLPAQCANAGVVAWGDINRDGLPDLFVGGYDDTPSMLYLNYGGTFYDVTSEYLHTNIQNVTKAEFLDYDGDGLLDLFVLTGDGLGAQLFRQTPDHQFIPVDVTAGTPFSAPVRSAVWNDVDGNGTLDLILSNGPTSQSPVTVFTQYQGEFNEMRDNPFENLVGVGAITMADFDFDGHSEIFFGYGDGAQSSHFYKWNGVAWCDWAQRFDFPTKLGSRGAVWLDYDNDRRMDLFCTGETAYTTMLRGTLRYGTDGLQPVTVPGLVDGSCGGFEVHVVDANVDGWPDLFITKSAGLGCALLMNETGERFVDKALGVGIANPGSTNYSAAWADYNRDGAPDVAVAQGTSGVRLYRNNLRLSHEYMAINLLSSDTHTPVANCNVWMDWQQSKQIATTFPSISASSCDASTILLVNRTTVKADNVNLVVQWPNGITRRYTLGDVTKNQVNNLYEPANSEDPNTMERSRVLTASVPQVISPNPFNPTTNISFNLPEAANVQLKVYNVMGQEVATLVNGALEAGNHRVTFDAGALPSGLYISRLTAGGTSSMTRMLLMK